MRIEALRRRESQRESNQQKKEGARYGTQERGNNFEVIFQGLLFQKNLKDVFWGLLGDEKLLNSKTVKKKSL